MHTHSSWAAAAVWRILCILACLASVVAKVEHGICEPGQHGTEALTMRLLVMRGNCEGGSGHCVDKFAQKWGNLWVDRKTDVKYRVCVDTATLDELGMELAKDFAREEPIYHAYVGNMANYLIEYASTDRFADLTPFIRADQSLMWDDVVPFFRSIVNSYEDTVRLMFFDGDVHSLFYRHDVLASRGWAVPVSLSELVEQAKILNGTDINEDGEPDFGFCINLGDVFDSYFMGSVVAPYLQTKGPEDGFFFDADTFEPKVASLAAVEGLRTFKELLEQGTDFTYFTSGLGEAAVRGLFLSGRCAFALDWGGLPRMAFRYNPRVTQDPGFNRSYASERLRTAPWPGTSRVRGPDGSVTECDSQLCPHARSQKDLGNDGRGQTRLVNIAPYNAFGGLSVAVNNHKPPAEIAAAYEFLSFWNHPAQSTLDVVDPQSWFEPFRNSQFLPFLWTTEGMSSQQAQSYSYEMRSNLESDNLAAELRVRGANDYLDVLKTGAAGFIGYDAKGAFGKYNGEPGDAAYYIEFMNREIDDVTLYYGGREVQRDELRQLFNLPPMRTTDTSPLTTFIIIFAIVLPVSLIALVMFVVALRWFHERRRYSALYSNQRIATQCAVAIANMELDSTQEFLEGIREPNQIQDAFIRIVAILQEYKAYLPAAVLATEADRSPQGDNPLITARPEKARRHVGMSGNLRKCRVSVMISAVDFTYVDTDDGPGSPQHITAMTITQRFVEKTVETAQLFGGTFEHCNALQGSFVQVCVLFNAHRPAPRHQSSSCHAGLSIADECLSDPSVRSCAVGLSSGMVVVGEAGTKVIKSSLVMGTALSWATTLQELARQLKAGVVCDERHYGAVRTEISGRLIDAIHMPNGEEGSLHAQSPPTLTVPQEMLVYQLQGHVTREVSSKDFAAAFSELRAGNYEVACKRFQELLMAEADAQAWRLFRIAAMMDCSAGPRRRYLRQAQQTRFQNIEEEACSGPLPSKYAHLEELNRRREKHLTEEASPNRRLSNLEDRALFTQQLSTMLLNNVSRSTLEPPIDCEDAKGRKYHRSSVRLGSGAFGEVWMGMADDGSMVAMKFMAYKEDQEEKTEVAEGAHLSRGSSGKLSSRPISVEVTDAPLLGFRSLPTEHIQQERGTKEERAKAVTELIVKEVSLMISLQHENIVQYLGCGVAGSRALILMEYVPGGSLRTLATQFGGVLPTVCVPRFVADILRGLVYIHENDVVHQDLKPANVLVTAEGQARIADFGAAKIAETAAGDSTGAAGPVGGTLLYMAPEQARGSAEPKSDVWALGIVLLELLTGQITWGPRANGKTFPYLLVSDPNCVPSIPELIPENAASLARSCLSRSPAERPSALELLSHPFVI
eukprot:Hpha_TRINITY_DN15740_c0_g1::TRINITY_DN15740_c0_g1_i1::g.37459::m.37459